MDTDHLREDFGLVHLELEAIPAAPAKWGRLGQGLGICGAEYRAQKQQHAFAAYFRLMGILLCFLQAL